MQKRPVCTLHRRRRSVGAKLRRGFFLKRLQLRRSHLIFALDARPWGTKRAAATVAHVLSIAEGASVGMSAAAVDALNNNKAEMLGSSHSSKYDAMNDRCYARLYGAVARRRHRPGRRCRRPRSSHRGIARDSGGAVWHRHHARRGAVRAALRLYEHKRTGDFETESHTIYDVQTDALLAFARRVNGKEIGYVFDVHKGTSVANCTACALGVGWDAAIAYMDGIITDKPN
jgi:hypothetical protein